MANPPTAIATLIGSTAVPTVILRHDLPDGSHHFDWMLANDAEGQLPLITFRLERPLDELQPGDSMRAERIADHRPHYLTYEGPVSDQRGEVRQVRSGTIRRGATDESTAEIHWNRHPPTLPPNMPPKPLHSSQPQRQTIRLRDADFGIYTVFCVGISG